MSDEDWRCDKCWNMVNGELEICPTCGHGHTSDDKGPSTAPPEASRYDRIWYRFSVLFMLSFLSICAIWEFRGTFGLLIFFVICALGLTVAISLFDRYL